MKRVKEYIRMVGRGIPNIDQVVEGIWNSIKGEFNMLSEEEREEILKRRIICMGCPFFSKNLFKDDGEYRKLYNKPFESNRVGEEFCGICSCPIATRTASLSSECGIAYHNEKYNDNIPLKWHKFKKDDS